MSVWMWICFCFSKLFCKRTAILASCCALRTKRCSSLRAAAAASLTSRAATCLALAASRASSCTFLASIDRLQHVCSFSLIFSVEKFFYHI